MPAPLRLDLPVLLPEIPDARDACATRLVDALTATPGVSRAHVVEAAGGEPAQLCLHYDPAVVALPTLRRTAERAGAQITGQFGHVLWDVRGLGHQSRARTVTTRLAKLPGVAEATANARGPLRIEFDRAATTEARLREALSGLGVTVVSDRPTEVGAVAHDDHAGHDHGTGEHEEHAGHDHEPGGHDDHAGHGPGVHGGHSHGGIFGEKTEIIFAGLAGVCVALGWSLGAFTGAPESVPLGLYLAAIFFGGWFTVSEAVGSIRAGRFEIDFLMIVAAAGAAALGEWFEAALLLALFSIGHGLEGYAMGRARRAIEALSELAPETAIVRRDGAEQEIAVGDLRVGDTVVVRTNARLPADGFVTTGTSTVNQAPVTGESVPVNKQPVADAGAALKAPDTVGPESRVFAGTLNGTGALEIVVTRTSGESTLARVVQMVAEAETEQSPTQRFTDRFERIFVPAVLALVVALLVGPPALKALGVFVTEPFSASFYRAMAVLVAASPCALAIATPSAVLSGVARAGRQGVLVKGGGPLEALGAVQVIAFDKTGTLTEGAPRVTDVVPADGATEAELLEAAVAVERLSDHPLARAVVAYGDEKGTARVEAHDLQSVTGFGIRATVGGEAVGVGKSAMFEDGLPAAVAADVERLEADGRTTFVVQRGARFLGVVGLMDAPREAARDTIARLRALGVQRMVMISGDNQRVADAVARAVGLDEARGDLLPDDKVAAITALAGDGAVAMVGDGVNDAPAMARATVGIAMGAAGSDVALETADVALMGDDLAQLPFAVGLSRHTRGIIRQNLWISLGMVAFLVPATLWGLNIGPAVALHEGSTLVVVFNALRLLAYRGDGA